MVETIGKVLGTISCGLAIAVILAILPAQPGGLDWHVIYPLIFGWLPAMIAIVGFLMPNSSEFQASTRSLIRVAAVAALNIATLLFVFPFVFPSAGFIDFMIGLFVLVFYGGTLVRALRNHQKMGAGEYLVLEIGTGVTVCASMIGVAVSGPAFLGVGILALIVFSAFMATLVIRGAQGRVNPEPGLLILSGTGNLAVFSVMAVFSVGLLVLPLTLVALVGGLCVEVEV